MAWRQGRSPNGNVVVFDSIETFVSFFYVWYVCVAAGCRMIVWQRRCQMKCTRQKSCSAMAEGYAAV